MTLSSGITSFELPAERLTLCSREIPRAIEIHRRTLWILGFCFIMIVIAWAAAVAAMAFWLPQTTSALPEMTETVLHGLVMFSLIGISFILIRATSYLYSIPILLEELPPHRHAATNLPLELIIASTRYTRRSIILLTIALSPGLLAFLAALYLTFIGQLLDHPQFVGWLSLMGGLSLLYLYAVFPTGKKLNIFLHAHFPTTGAIVQ